MVKRIRSILTRIVRIAASALVAAILLITIMQVILRYVFSIALPWSAEAAQLLLVYTVMIVAAGAVGTGKHFSLPILIEALPGKPAGLIRRLHDVVIIAFSMVLLVYGFRLAFGQMSQKLPAIGLPVGILYFALPFGALLIMVFSILRLLDPDYRTEAGSGGPIQ